MARLGVQRGVTRLNQLTNATREILLVYWDPIRVGDVPKVADEYDAYTLPIVRMVADGTSVAELSRYLLEIETDRLGLKGDPDRARLVAAKLLSLT